jgi:hypothetical protein
MQRLVVSDIDGKSFRAELEWTISGIFRRTTQWSFGDCACGQPNADNGTYNAARSEPRTARMGNAAIRKISGYVNASRLFDCDGANRKQRSTGTPPQLVNMLLPATVACRF